MWDGEDFGRAPNHDVADSGSEHVPDHEVVDSADGQAVQNSPVSSHEAEDSGQENEHNPVSSHDAEDSGDESEVAKESPDSTVSSTSRSGSPERGRRRRKKVNQRLSRDDSSTSEE
jgi:hypothetical protein